ncbi:DUF1372 family protein [Streptococcus sp. 29887]|uniref:DUF1372 family protein n=1 Tax=Streptococcus iners TaxID=3028084 RepID=A0AA97A2Z9_9STRE|nr:DUF1372 family protein [Streptococcus sp. 29887]WNY51513.1 DUF1372 family protein [Streptococcus sp. 29887]
MIIAIIFGIALIAALLEINRLESREPIIIYRVGNEGIDMFGKVTAKDVVDGHYYVEVKPYGKFLVTREQYDSVSVGDEMPEWLKGRKK